MPRPIWRGHVTFGLVNIPVILYSAERRSDLHFNLLDSRTHARIRYERVNESTGEEVPWGQIVKGYEYDDGRYVLLGDEDFKRAAVEATKTIEIEDFVERESIKPTYYERPYYLVPVKKSEKGYVLLRETLKRTQKVGISKVVIHSRQYLAALFSEGDALVLNLLRFPQELVKAGEFDLPKGSLEKYHITKKEVGIAEELVKNMSSTWKPEKYHDDYRDALMKWIEKKVKAGDLEAAPASKDEPEAEKGEVIDIMHLLQKSLQKTTKDRPRPRKAQAGRRR